MLFMVMKQQLFYLSNGEIFEGAFPYKAKKLVKKLIEKYQKELNEMWETGIYTKLKGLD